MVRNGDYVAVFHSIHRVMQAENLLKAAGVEFLLIPAPRQLSADCGLAIRFAPEQRAEIAAVLEPAGLQPAELYRRREEEYRPAEWTEPA